MKQRTRKALGIFLTVGFLLAYSLGIMAASAMFVVGAPALIELIFFIIAGLAWLPVVMAIIKWMNRP